MILAQKKQLLSCGYDIYLSTNVSRFLKMENYNQMIKILSPCHHKHACTHAHAHTHTTPFTTPAVKRRLLN